MSISERPDRSRYWHGRKVFLSNKQSFFRCGGVSLNRANPVLIIDIDDPFIQVHHVEKAVEEGILLDITDNNKGLGVDGIGHTNTKIENTGKKVYITEGRDGGMAIIGADTPEESAAYDLKLQRTHVIVPDNYKIAAPLDQSGRLMHPEDMGLVLQNLGEKIEAANQKVEQQGLLWRVGGNHEKKAS